MSRVLKVEAAHYAEPLAESLAVLAQRVAGEGGYRAVLVGATSFGKNLAPRVAALLDVAAVSDVVAISAPGRYERPIYAGQRHGRGRVGSAAGRPHRTHDGVRCRRQR
ncbi:hypothetical protein MASR2M50_24280 [Thauera sp.]